MASGDSYSQNVAQQKNLGYVVDTGVKTDTSEVSFLQTSIGEAIITDAVAASGNLAASGNPANGDALPALNGFDDITFVTADGVFPDVTIQGSRALTMAYLAGQINSAVATNPILYSQLAGFTYSSDSTHLIITANEGGTAGNNFTIGANAGVWTRSGATLSGGAAATVDYPGSAGNPLVTSGTLPTGAATAANQATQITAEQAIQALLGGTGGLKDNGPLWTVTRTVTTSSDMSTAAAISPAPTSGQKLIGDDFIVSTDTAMSFTIQEETSEDIFAVIYLPDNGTAVITTRDGLKTNAIDKKFFGKASVPGNVSITACTHSV